MEVIADFFLDHFDQYGCKFYRSSSTEIEGLDDVDTQWLTQIGLPDGAIPFFFFDFYIGMLRGVEPENCKFMLGSAFEPASRHYVFINNLDEVVIHMENDMEFFVNSSLHQLCECIYAYSRWLEEQEEAFNLNPDHSVCQKHVFEIFYRLRDIDRAAFTRDVSIWPQLVHSEIRFLSDSLD